MSKPLRQPGKLERLARAAEVVERVQQRWKRTPRARRVVILAEAGDLLIAKLRARGIIRSA